MAKDYIRLKRGMVFTYNIDPSVDKYEIPKIKLNNGKEIQDHLQYGYRTYLVVSNDTNNASSPTCNIVPMTTKIEKADIPTHVNITYRGNELTILCEHIYTVNTMELFKYEYTLAPEVMDRVDEAIAVQLNLSNKVCNSNVTLALDKIESIISGIVAQRVEELTKPIKANEVDIEDAVLRIGEGLVNLLSEPTSAKESKEVTVTSNEVTEPPKTSQVVKTKEEPKKPKGRESQVDKFYRKYENNERKEDKKRRQWTPEIIEQFLKDVDELSPTEMVSKYNFRNMQDFYASKHYIQNKSRRA